MNLYFLFAFGLIALGLGLLVYNSLAVISDVIAGGARLARRRWKPRDVYRILGIEDAVDAADNADEANTRKTVFFSILLKPYFWVAAGTVAALSASDMLLSPALFAIVVVGGLLYRSRQTQSRLSNINQDTGELIIQFSSRYPVSQSVSRALRESATQLPSGSEVRQAALETVNRFRLNQPFQAAIRPLSDLPNASLAQFGRVIAASQDTPPEVFYDTLSMLRTDVENRRELHNLARQSLTLVRSTARVLQAVLAASLVFVAVAGSWRTYFTTSPSHIVYYLVALVAGAIGSIYIEAEINQLEQ